MTNPWTTDKQSAFDLMASTLKAWGLTALLGDLRKLVSQGTTSGDVIALALSETDAYKRRFAGNALRRAAGLRELSPAEYLATEEQYYGVLRAYGLPSGFYDSHDDFTKLIGGDVSPAELESRAKVAHDQYESAPAEYKASWQEYFGTKGDAIAAILDPKVGTQIIQDRAQQAALGGEALRAGFHVSQLRAQEFQRAGISIEQARKAYADVGRAFGTDQAIAQRFGTDFTLEEEEDDLLLGDAEAGLKRQTLYAQEEALFKSRPGTDANALGVSQSY